MSTVWMETRRRAADNPQEWRELRDRLLKVRERFGFTQQDLAEVLGVSKVSIARVEMMAGFKPRQRFLDKLSKLESSDIGREE